jgi:hypothetical protein
MAYGPCHKGDADLPGRWRAIKTTFLKCLPAGESRSAVMTSRGERGIWQRPYWEHTIRDDREFTAHMDYTHFNPVKRGLLEHPADWRICRFAGAWMADCIPTGGEAAVINRNRQASGLRSGRGDRRRDRVATGGPGGRTAMWRRIARRLSALRLLLTSRSIGDHSNANPAFQSGAASIGLRAFNASSVYPITPFQ